MPKKYLEDDFKNYCHSRNLEYIGFHMQPKKGSIVEFICNRHRDKGVQNKDWSHLKTYTYGCSYCSGRNKTTEEISKEIKNKDVKLISEYLGNEKPIRCKCLKCDNEWTTLPKVLITNGAGCPKCGREKANKSEQKSQEQFVEEMQRVDNTITIIGEYKGTHKWIECKCKLCDKEFQGHPARLLRKESGCPYCNASLGEKALVQALNAFNIAHITEYRFKSRENKKCLRFDAYDANNKIAFEFNGEQHYYPVNFGGKKYDAQKQFELTQKRDMMKKRYCDENGIVIIYIPYWEKSHVKEYLLKQFKKKGLYLNKIETV